MAKIEIATPIFDCCDRHNGKTIGRIYRWPSGETSTIWFIKTCKDKTVLKPIYQLAL